MGVSIVGGSTGVSTRVRVRVRTDPLEHVKPKHEKTGTSVTFLATPCFRPPTVEATWVPCPLHPEPSAGRTPLTA